MKRKRTTTITELQSLADRKDKLLLAKKNNLDIISAHTIDTSKLLEAKRIAEKLDKGENICEEDKNKLDDIKNKYESFFDDEDTTDKNGLEDAICYIKDEKESYINKDKKLQKKIEELAKEKTDVLAKEKTDVLPKEKTEELAEEKTEELAEEKKSKSSLIDDFADLSGEMPDIWED